MLKKVVTYVPSVFVPMILNFLLVFIYADVLSPDEYGVFNIYLNTISFLYSFVLSFLQSAAYRFYASCAMKDMKVYLSTYLLANVTISIMLAAILLVLNSVVFKFDWWLISTTIFVNALYQFFINLSRLEGKVGKFTLCRVLTVGMCLAAMLLIKFKQITISYLVPIILVYVSYFVFVIIELFRVFRDISFHKFSWKLFKDSMSFGLPMMGFNMAGLVLAYCDQYLLLYYCGETEVGYYSLGYRLADTIIVNLTSVILLVFTPILMEKFDCGKKEECSQLLSKEINLNYWITLPIVVFLIMYAGNIIAFFFPAYNEAISVIRWVVLAGFFHGVTYVICKGLELVKKTNVEFYILLFVAVINCTYNIIFIPIYGMTAAAHSSLIAYVIETILIMIVSKRYMPIRVELGSIGKTTLITFLTMCVAVVMQHLWKIETLIVFATQSIILVACYVSLSLVFKQFRDFSVEI